jgi:hypothetical protein
MTARSSISIAALLIAAISIMTYRPSMAATASSHVSSSCHDLQVSQDYCLESYSKCAKKPCESVQLPSDATCFHANYLFCKYQIPDCCCGQEMMDAMKCQLPGCTINCGSLFQASSSSVQECTSESLFLNACLDSLDTGLGNCNETCPSVSSFNIPADATCAQMTDQICSISLPACCCRQEIINQAECNFAKQHGVTCKVNCAVTMEQQVSAGSGTSSTKNDSGGSSQLNKTIVTALSQGTSSSAVGMGARSRPMLFALGAGLLLVMG